MDILAVRPGCVDLRPDVADLELGQRALEAVEHRPHAQLDRLLEQAEDPDRLLGRDGSDPGQESAVVVDQGGEVAGPRSTARAEEIERALEIDVPQLVGGGPLVARPRRPDVAWTVAAVAGEDPVDLAVAERPHGASAERGSDPSAVPVGQQADGEDESLEGRRQLARAADPRAIEERLETTLLEARTPAEQVRSAAAELCADRGQRLTVSPPPERGSAAPKDGRWARAADVVGGSPALGRHEQEVRSLLVVVPTRQPPRVRIRPGLDFRHPRPPRRAR